MATSGIKPGANHSIFHTKTTHQITHSKSLHFLPNPSKKRIPQRLFASMALPSSSTPTFPPSNQESVSNQTKDSISSSKLHHWIEESAQDIVKNLKQAPLLVHIYNGNANEKPKFKTEKAVKTEWRNHESEKSPDGLIFVEEIEKKEYNGDGDCEKNEEEEGETKAWGILVQGKGVENGAACYLLKTSRVNGGLGLGICCTHFSLIRVQSFNKTALRQFKDSWLLR